MSRSPAPIRVLFVCLGNICRSPMAEAVLRHKVEQAGLTSRIEIDSAGTGDWHVGASPHHGTLQMLVENGISSEGIRARQITPRDLTVFDYIITMDADNLRNVRRLGTPAGAVIRSLLEYAPELGLADVPDPYYTGAFAEVYSLIDSACDALLAAIRRDHHL